MAHLIAVKYRLKDDKIKRLITIAAIIFCTVVESLLNSGCLAQAVIDSNERQAFASLNLEREKAGLTDLTWEQYHNHGFHD